MSRLKSFTCSVSVLCVAVGFFGLLASQIIKVSVVYIISDLTAQSYSAILQCNFTVQSQAQKPSIIGVILNSFSMNTLCTFIVKQISLSCTKCVSYYHQRADFHLAAFKEPCLKRPKGKTVVMGYKGLYSNERRSAAVDVRRLGGNGPVNYWSV